MPASLRREIRYKFYATRSGLGATVRNVYDHMRAYYVARIGGASADVRSLNDLEKQWLRLVITTAGGTPSSNYLSTLWTQAVAIKGLTVSKKVEENQLTYWLNVTSANGL